jgi:hypothetical protein
MPEIDFGYSPLLYFRFRVRSSHTLTLIFSGTCLHIRKQTELVPPSSLLC